MGLAWASNLAILTHTVTLAVLLHGPQAHAASAGESTDAELMKSLLAAIVSVVIVMELLRVLPEGHGHLWNALLLTVGVCVWAGVCWTILRLTKAHLPAELMRRARA